jgi:ankyrin repeat protein
MNSTDRELFMASSNGSLPEVSRLWSVGADVNVKDGRGWTPLHAASFWGHVQVVKELREYGADIDAKTKDGWTPLHCACCMGHLAVVQALHSRGANMEAQTNEGYTPLHFASWKARLRIVKALLSGDVDILAANNQGRLPIHFAVSEGKSAVAKHLLQEFYATISRHPLHELLKDLTWIGNPNSNILDVPSLPYALNRNVLGTDDVVEILEYLIDRDPTLLRSRGPDGSLPLHVACRRGASFTIIQSLVDLYKASVKILTSEGDLPLFLACEIPEPSLNTIFLLTKMYPDLVYR